MTPVPTALIAPRRAERHGPGAEAEAAAPALPVADQSGRRRTLGIAAVALLGLIASIVLAIIFGDADARLSEEKFAELARDYQQSIADSLARVTDVVKVEQAYFETSDTVTRREFEAFAKTVRETLAFGLRDTTWLPRVTAAQRAAFEQQVRAEGVPGFEIRERDAAGRMVRAADRAEYFPAVYIDAGELTPKVLGYDLASEHERLRALTLARVSGQPAVTSAVKLSLLRPGDIPSGYIIFVPVFGGSGAVRAETLQGFVIGVLAAGRLVEYVLSGKADAQDLDVYLFDPAAPPATRQIYAHASRARPAPAVAPTEAGMRGRPHVETTVRMADRDWGLLVARPPSSATWLGGRGLAALLIGCTVTLGVSAHLTASLRHALRLEAMTAQLRRTGADLLSKGEQIAHLAHYDALTGLPNRVTFRERLQIALRRAGPGAPPCVMWLDLDRFKAVNDTFGHQVGDALLGLVAARLRGCLRADDIVARIGGDEFVVLLEQQGPSTAEALARRLLEAIRQPYVIRSHLVSVGLSVGIAFPAEGSLDEDLLMRNADFALYRAKQEGRGAWRWFEPVMEAAATARRSLEANLRAAIGEMAFELHFQPLIRLSDRQICGFEALLRWNCPGRGFVSPAEFVPLAEECGLIVPIGEWVLATACREAAKWPVPVRVAVNISAAQFVSPSLIANVESAIADAGFDPARLELEITETLLLQDSSEMLAKLQALKDRGISISMDDFGTGYSSLSYLRKFPFDTLKIDQSFVRDLPHNADCRAIVHAVTGLCRTLGITTVAEGVETVEQLRGVLAEGCNEAQGFLFSRAVPAAQVAGLLIENGHHFAAA